MRAAHALGILVAAGLVIGKADALPLMAVIPAGTENHPAAGIAANTADYIRNAAIGDGFAIASAKVAIKKAHNSDVHRFAQMMLNDRAAIDDSLAATLKGATFSMTLPQSIDSEHVALVKQLEETPADRFDTDYMRQQVMMYESALRLHQSYAKDGRDQSLRRYAAEVTPKVRLELALAEHLFRRVSPRFASVR